MKFFDTQLEKTCLLERVVSNWECTPAWVRHRISTSLSINRKNLASQSSKVCIGRILGWIRMGPGNLSVQHRDTPWWFNSEDFDVLHMPTSILPYNDSLLYKTSSLDQVLEFQINEPSVAIRIPQQRTRWPEIKWVEQMQKKAMQTWTA
jgi:hypothetical protein